MSQPVISASLAAPRFSEGYVPGTASLNSSNGLQATVRLHGTSNLSQVGKWITVIALSKSCEEQPGNMPLEGKGLVNLKPEIRFSQKHWLLWYFHQKKLAMTLLTPESTIS